MATYIPGVQGYYPEFEPFVPDYKFLSGVLDQRTDRYNTNYKAVNDLYSKVVYADLTRDDSIEMRDQYANLLAPKLEQVASMDLSIQQNADAAKALFQPFYDNDLVVKDMVTTQQYKKELGYANSLLESDDRKIREKYWQTGVEALQYQMKDFKDAAPDKALKMALPKYVPDANLYEMSLEVLKESGLSIEQDKLDPSGYWIIKQKNGSIVTPIAFETVKRTLMDDPRVINAYYTDAYVKSRKFADEGMASGQFGTLDEGRTSWANNIIADIQAKTLAQNQKTKENVKQAEDVKNNWEQYQKQYGIIEGSDEDLAMVEALAKYDAEKSKLQSEEDILRESQDPAPTDENLISKAYNMLMSYNISGDMMAAAQQYSMRDASLTFKSNPYKEMELDHAHQNALALANHRYRLKELEVKHGYDKQLDDYQNRFRNGLMDVFSKALGGNAQTSIFDKDGDGKPDTDADVVKFNQQSKDVIINDVTKEQINSIKNAHVAIESLKGKNGQTSMITVQTSNGLQTVSLNQFDKVMSDPANSIHLARTFSDYHNKVSNAATEIPTLTQQSVYNDLRRSFENTDKRMAAVVEAMKIESKTYNDNIQAVKQTAYGKPLVEMEKKGIPSIISTPLKQQLQNQQDNADPVTNSAKNAMYLASGGLDIPFKSDQTQPKLLSREEYRAEFIKKYNAVQIKDVEPKSFGRDLSKSPSAKGVTSMGGWLVLDTNEEGGYGQTLADVADENYDAQMKILNNTMTGAIVPTKTADGKSTATFKTFGFDQYMRGMSVDEMTVGNISTFPIYKQFVDPTTLNEQSYNAIKDLATQYVNTPNAVIVKGDLTGESETPTQSEKTAKDIFSAFMLDFQAAYTNPEAYKGKAPRVNVSYAPVYGAPSGDRQNAAYILEIDPEYIKEKFAGASEDSKTYITNKQVPDYSKITMLFPRTVDVNPKNSEEYNFSYVQNRIQSSPDAKFTYEVPKGGYMEIIKNGDKWLYSANIYAYDQNTGNFVPQDYVTPTVLTNRDGKPATMRDLDYLVGGIQEVLKASAQQGMEVENLNKRNRKNQ